MILAGLKKVPVKNTEILISHLQVLSIDEVKLLRVLL